MLALGSPEQVLTLVERILAHRKNKELPESLIEDWCAVLADMPLNSIWEIYQRFIRSTEEWLPTAGQFRARCEAHADSIRATANTVSAAITKGA